MPNISIASGVFKSAISPAGSKMMRGRERRSRKIGSPIKTEITPGLKSSHLSLKPVFFEETPAIKRMPWVNSKILNGIKTPEQKNTPSAPKTACASGRAI